MNTREKERDREREGLRERDREKERVCKGRDLVVAAVIFWSW